MRPIRTARTTRDAAVAPDGALFIVTKGETDAIGLYRFPRELDPAPAIGSNTSVLRPPRASGPPPNG